MKFDIHEPPRDFSPYPGLTLRDMGDLYLAADEQVTVRVTPERGNDVVRKPWGFYLTNSLNGTLRGQGLKTALARGAGGRLYVLLVDEERLPEFEIYLAQYGLRMECWLDEWDEPGQAPPDQGR